MVEFKPLPSKRDESFKLKVLVAKFLQEGGEIQYIPEGQRGKCLPRDFTLDKVHKLPSGARCIICDWSPTDSRSIINPEIADRTRGQLVIDNLTGDMLCQVCLAAAAKMNRDFKIAADPEYGQSRYLLNDEAKELLRSDGHFEEHRGKRQVYDPVLLVLTEGAKRKGWSGHQES